MKNLICIFITLCYFNSMHSQTPVFNHLAIYVTDLNKSANFYKDIIGLNSIPDPFKDEKHAWFSIGSNGELHIIAGAASKTDHSQDNHTCFSVPSIDIFIQRLVKSGISYVNARGEKSTVTVRPDGVKQIYFQDPDGYWIEVNDAAKK